MPGEILNVPLCVFLSGTKLRCRCKKQKQKLLILGPWPGSDCQRPSAVNRVWVCVLRSGEKYDENEPLPRPHEARGLERWFACVLRRLAGFALLWG